MPDHNYYVIVYSETTPCKPDYLEYNNYELHVAMVWLGVYNLTDLSPILYKPQGYIALTAWSMHICCLFCPVAGHQIL